MDSIDTNLTLKLLVNKETNKVLLAEASNEVVDFLFGLLEMPIGYVVKILTTQMMSGSFGNLFKSVEALDATYLNSTQVKASLLDPILPGSLAATNKLFLLPPEMPSASGPKQYFRCPRNGCSEYFSSVSTVNCPACGNVMTGKATMLDAAGLKPQPGEGVGETRNGYVKGLVTYAITDDLCVTPMSTISSIALLNKLNIKDLGVLEETTVKIGFDEGVELLKSSLQSKSVLRILAGVSKRGILLSRFRNRVVTVARKRLDAHANLEIRCCHERHAVGNFIFWPRKSLLVG